MLLLLLLLEPDLSVLLDFGDVGFLPLSSSESLNVFSTLLEFVFDVLCEFVLVVFIPL